MEWLIFGSGWLVVVLLICNGVRNGTHNPAPKPPSKTDLAIRQVERYREKARR